MECWAFPQSLLSERFPGHPAAQSAGLREEQETQEVGLQLTDPRWHLLSVGYLDSEGVENVFMILLFLAFMCVWCFLFQTSKIKWKYVFVKLKETFVQ